MKIALLIHSLQGGGAERLMSDLANRWVRDHEIHLVTWSTIDTDSYPLSTSVLRHGLDLMQPSQGLLNGILANLRRVQRLRRKLGEIEPDWILSFSDQMNIVALEAGRGRYGIHSKVPQWIAEHSNPREQKLSPLWEAWRRRVYPKCSGCVVLTQEIAEYATRWVPSKRVRVIPPALSSLPEKQEESDTASESKTLLYVGRLSEEKSLEVLLDAWKIVQDELPSWKLVLVGDGPERKRLENRAAECKRTTFVGWTQQPEQYYRNAQLFVLSSRYEGFPVALLEAMSHGIPCLSTDCSSALRELRTDNCDNDLRSSESLSIESSPVEIVPVGDSRAMARAMLELCRSDTRLREMSGVAWEISRRYSWENIGKLWDQLLTLGDGTK